ncbi:hypothetical protein [Flexithrix dorotheae]|nr:hypothetical protein [Flexithrix dorotheae]
MRKKLHFSLLFSALILGFSLMSYAQDKGITGKVTSSEDARCFCNY